VNGPFGNLANNVGEDPPADFGINDPTATEAEYFGDFTYIADDNQGSLYIDHLPEGSIQICSAWSPGYHGHLVPQSASYVWYHPQRNFFFIGDSVGVDTIANTTPDGWPVIFDYSTDVNVKTTTGAPIPKLYGYEGYYNSTGFYGRQMTYNPVLEYNALAWAMNRAATHGVNDH
jgi:hypothetical protein